MTDTAYINRQAGREAILSESTGRKYYIVRFDDRELQCTKTLEEAEQLLAKRGYVRKGFTDEQGVLRHALSNGRIVWLNRELDNFIADLTTEEWSAYREAFIQVKTIIHKRMQDK